MRQVRHLQRQAAPATVAENGGQNNLLGKFPGDPLLLTPRLVDEEMHIKVKDDQACHRCLNKPCTYACPSQVFEWEEDHVRVKYPRCMECGACRLFCPEGNILMEYPRGGYGLNYRY
ncbi:4Fe-4S dicluster domain-containing protein [Moorella naiadis]|uniref:ferredoxin family protein n=1 Tax=Moorella naiadis (nom. illeg.) TaxID=3093670 RepID=UPI003D9CA6EB